MGCHLGTYPTGNTGSGRKSIVLIRTVAKCVHYGEPNQAPTEVDRVPRPVPLLFLHHLFTFSPLLAGSSPAAMVRKQLESQE
jgi:hypothetical protein